MEQLQLQRLSAKKSSKEVNTLTIFGRIHSEHVFTSVEESIEYLGIIIHNKSLNLNNILPIYSEVVSPILLINIVDEAICTIIYAIFSLVNHQDKDSLGYYSNLLSDFKDDLVNVISYNKDDNKLCFYRALLMMINDIFDLCVKYIADNEFKTLNVSRSYYNLMVITYETYGDLKNNYFIQLRNFYKNCFFAHEEALRKELE